MSHKDRSSNVPLRIALIPVKVDEMKPTPLHELLPHLGSAGAAVEKRAGTRPLHVQGRTVRDRRRWEALSPGDMILFSGNGAVRRIGTVVGKVISASFSRAKWPPREYGADAVWDHLLVIAMERDVEIPYSLLNEVSGDSPRYVPFGFRIMGAEKGERVIRFLMERGIMSATSEHS